MKPSLATGFHAVDEFTIQGLTDRACHLVTVFAGHVATNATMNEFLESQELPLLDAIAVASQDLVRRLMVSSTGSEHV